MERWKSVKIPSAMYDKIQELIKADKVLLNSVSAFVQATIYKEISSLETPVDKDEL